jgi:GNAT superfamily N-acetyltransferase
VTAPSVTVREYRSDDRREVVAALARAFAIDPLFDFFSRDLLHGHRLLPSLFKGFLGDLEHYGKAWVTEVDGRPLGFGGWLPASAYPRGMARELSLTARTMPTMLRSAHRMAALRLFAEVERRHLKAPHWYLGLLAVDPTLQGRGLGSQLITPGIEAADEEGMPCYLETQRESNVAWYARFGFELTETVELGGGTPPIWCLTRPAR